MNFEDGLPSGMKINFIGLRFVLEDSSDFRDRGNLKNSHDAIAAQGEGL